MRTLCVSISLLLLCLNSAVSEESGFINRSVNLDGNTYHYQVYVPRRWSKDTRWPVFLFLHGAGERGSDGLKQTLHGLPEYIRQHADRFNAIAVMPQVSKDHWWSDAVMSRLAMATLEQAINRYHGDRHRIYLTGLSMGGYGTWHLASKYPNYFAAIAPVAGRLRPPQGVAVASDSLAAQTDKDIFQNTAKHVMSSAIWVFHGTKDDVVPVSESRQIVAALTALGVKVKYTEYEDLGHSSWTRSYNHDLYDWFLSHNTDTRPKLTSTTD